MRKLQDDFPSFKVLTIKECLDELNWTYDEDETGFINIKCDCGEDVIFGGWESPNEHGYCESCEKGMQNLLGLLPTSDGGKCRIKIENYDISDKRHWIPNDIW